MRLTAALLVSCLLVPPAVAELIRVPVWTQPGVVLSREGLTARIGGRTARVERLQGPSDDLMVLLVLDLTGNLNQIEMARDGLVLAVMDAPPNVHLGALRAQGGLKVLLDPTGERDAMTALIRDFPVAGTPGLLETIESASHLADSIYQDQPIRLAVFYVTDSEIGRYREDFSNPVVNQSDRGDMSRRFPETIVRERIARLDANLSSSLVPVFVAHLRYNSGSPLDEAYQNGILQLSAATGGEAVFCRSDAEIPGAIRAMMRRMIAHYAVDLEVPPDTPAVAGVSLESADAAALTYRSRYRTGAD